MKILVINAGSSSLKFQLIDMENGDVLAKGLCERIGIEGSNIQYTPKGGEKNVNTTPMANHADAIKLVIAALTDKDMGVIADMSEISAVGHRVVHGGEVFSESVVITDEVIKEIEACSELAPLHNPANLIGIKACAEIMPDCPMVAVFDTAFHQTMPKQAYMYALPYKFYEDYKIRRYGFHGTSHKFVSGEAAKLLGKDIKDLKIITLHLGNGSSITAVDGGKSVDTTMGFTPLAGVPMGTRSGDIDPAIISFIAKKENISADEVEAILNKKSGVAGVSKLSSDFRDLEAAANGGDEYAKLALDLFIYNVRKYIGTYAAVMGGVDAVVFTAGIGENNAKMRKAITANLEFMGIEIDDDKNNTRSDAIDISKDSAKVRTLVIATNEELMIAKETLALTAK